MAKAPLTSPSLLVRLRDPADQQAWAQFVDIYGVAIYGYGRKHGLQDADAADLTQAVLSRLALQLPRFRYDPQLGSFRAWLFTLVRNECHSVLRRQRGAATGDEATRQLLESQPANDREVWESACEEEALQWAAQQVRERVRTESWQAFWRTAVEAVPASQVAAELGLSTAAVYMAKSRVMAQLRALIQGLEEE